MGIGKRIKELRKQERMTQPELADKVGVHETTIRRWEQEKDKGPDTTMIKRLAEVLETTPESLLTDTQELTEEETEDKKIEEKNLVYEWGGKNRLALPNTPETRELFERLVIFALGGKSAVATA